MYSAEIVFALKSALQRGVDVTVVLNEPEYSWSGYDEDRQYGMASEINDAGGTVFLIGEPLDDSAPPSPYPYFHSKIAVKDNETVWIGSGNWKSSSHPTSDYSGNREWGIIIENSDIAEMILQRMDWDENPLHNHVLSYQSSMKPNGWTTPIPVGDQQPYGEFTPYTGSFSGKILTCPDDCMEGLVESINSADESIHLSLASFDLDWYWGWGENPILEALKQRAESGVKIHMVIDDTYSNPETREAIDMFNNDWNRTNGWDTSAVIMNTDSVVDSLHNKGMIIDGESVLISSINWNANSILRNREMGIIIDNEEIASVYLSSWQSDWDRLDDNTDSDGDTLPDYWEVQFGLNRTNAYITGSTSGEEDIDSENDSLINSLELLYGGNPTLADTDGDCIPDGKEAIWAMSLENLSNQAKIEFAKLAISSTDADNNSVNDGIQFECGINFDGTTTVELIDSDGDSVPDQDDQCSETPAGTAVNIYGCPLNTQIDDQDGDGIADSLDECPDTPANTGVSVYGCSDQQSRDKASSVTNEEDDSSKSNFFLLIIVFSGLLLCGSLFGIMRNRSNEDYEMADLSNEKVSLGSEDWEEVTLDASIMPVLDGTSESNVSSAEEPSIDNSLFPGWTEDVIQTYIDQGWSIEQLKDWYDQHS